MTDSEASQVPGIESLALYLAGAMPPAQARQLAEILATAPAQVQAQVEWLRRAQAAAEAYRSLPVPPPSLEQHLQQMFARWTADRDPEPLTTETILASATSADLAFDSATDPMLAGVRGAAPWEHPARTVRHLAYTCAVADVLLDVHLEGAQVSIRGQVLEHPATGSPVYDSGAETRSAAVRSILGDDHGRFQLPPVPTDVERVWVSNGINAVTVQLPPLRPSSEDGPDDPAPLR